jgi:hypothetical protein
MKKILSLVMLIAIILFAGEVLAATGLAWDASTGSPLNYTVYYAEGTSVGTTFNKTVPSSVTGVLFTALNISPGKTYTFIVRASNAAGESANSNSVTYSAPAFSPPTDVLPVAPPAVSGVPSSLRVN